MYGLNDLPEVTQLARSNAKPRTPELWFYDKSRWHVSIEANFFVSSL